MVGMSTYDSRDATPWIATVAPPLGLAVSPTRHQLLTGAPLGTMLVVCVSVTIWALILYLWRPGSENESELWGEASSKELNQVVNGGVLVDDDL